VSCTRCDATHRVYTCTLRYRAVQIEVFCCPSIRAGNNRFGMANRKPTGFDSAVITASGLFKSARRQPRSPTWPAKRILAYTACAIECDWVKSFKVFSLRSKLMFVKISVLIKFLVHDLHCFSMSQDIVSCHL